MSIGNTSSVPSGIETTFSSSVVIPILRACSTTSSIPTIWPRRTNAQFDERSVCSVIVPVPPGLLSKFSTGYGSGSSPRMFWNRHGPVPLTESLGT